MRARRPRNPPSSLLEELAARAWPAAEARPLDGWLLRHTPALTPRRSNSALPLVATVETVHARTAHAARAGDAVAIAARPGSAWVAAWASCEGRPDAEAHAREVLARIEPSVG